MYFGSSNGWSGIDWKGLWWFIAIFFIGVAAILTVLGYGIVQLLSHLRWV